MIYIRKRDKIAIKTKINHQRLISRQNVFRLKRNEDDRFCEFCGLKKKKRAETNSIRETSSVLHRDTLRLDKRKSTADRKIKFQAQHAGHYKSTLQFQHADARRRTWQLLSPGANPIRPNWISFIRVFPCPSYDHLAMIRCYCCPPTPNAYGVKLRRVPCINGADQRTITHVFVAEIILTLFQDLLRFSGWIRLDVKSKIYLEKE